MKSLIVMVMLAFVSACSSTPTKTYQGSDGGTTIRVTASGSTFEEAKSLAFNRAIEYVVGSVILNEKESRNDRLVRNEILNHSSGYVDSYTIINNSSNGRGVTLEMDVVVKHSKIAQRILNKSNTDTNINGDRLATQYGTYLQSRKSASAVTSTILSDYPTRAFSPKLIDSNFMLDGNNNARLIVRYKVDWNYNWVSAIDEALKMASESRDRGIPQEKITVTKRKPDSWIGSNETYYFNDRQFYNLVFDKLKPTVSVYAKVKDAHGNVIACKHSNHIGVITSSSIFIDGAAPFVSVFDFTFPSYSVKAVEAVSNIETGVTFDLAYCDKR